jgi:hypothetical protein
VGQSLWQWSFKGFVIGVVSASRGRTGEAKRSRERLHNPRGSDRTNPSVGSDDGRAQVGRLRRPLAGVGVGLIARADVFDLAAQPTKPNVGNAATVSETDLFTVFGSVR